MVLLMLQTPQHRPSDDLLAMVKHCCTSISASCTDGLITADAAYPGQTSCKVQHAVFTIQARAAG